MRNQTHHVASSLAERSNPITQYKSKPNTELSKPNTLTQRTEHRGVYQKKKKKIPNTQTKTKPSNPQTVTSPSSSPQRACRHCHHNGRPSSQIDIDIVDGRSVIGIRLIALLSAPMSDARQSSASLLPLPPAVWPPSRFFSLTLSLSLYLTE